MDIDATDVLQCIAQYLTVLFLDERTADDSHIGRCPVELYREPGGDGVRSGDKGQTGLDKDHVPLGGDGYLLLILCSYGFLRS